MSINGREPACLVSYKITIILIALKKEKTQVKFLIE